MTDLLSLSSLLGALVHDIETKVKEALPRVGEIVRDEARDELGTYQGAAGPTAAWDPLADSTKDRRVELGFPADEPGLRTGEIRDSITYIVDEAMVSIGSDLDKAEYFECGTATQPPRSFLVGAAYRKDAEIVKEIGASLDHIIR